MSGNYYGTAGNYNNEGVAASDVFMMTPTGTVTELHDFGITTNDGMNLTAGALRRTTA